MPSGDAMDEEKKDEKKAVALDAGDIALLKSYGVGPYAASIKALESDIEGELKKIGELVGVRESETGLAPQSSWDLHADKQMKQEEQPLHVGRCTKIINAGQEDAKYMIVSRSAARARLRAPRRRCCCCCRRRCWLQPRDSKASCSFPPSLRRTSGSTPSLLLRWATR
jgi:hypothetical protein